LKIVREKIFGRSGLCPETRCGARQRSPRPLNWWGLVSLPKNRTPLSGFGLDFWPFGPHWGASPKSLHFPQCVRVLIKTLVVPIFGAKECIRMQEFVLKIYQKFRGSRPPDPRAGRGDICSHPPHAHPPNAGAPPLLLGWLRPCAKVSTFCTIALLQK